MFCEKKKSKCPKKERNFQSVKRGKKKNVSVEFRVFEKKEIERKKKFRGKKIKVLFWMKILLSSCSLVGFYCEKEMFFKFGEKEKKVLGVGYPVSWAPCCERTKSWVPCCE